MLIKKYTTLNTFAIPNEDMLKKKLTQMDKVTIPKEIANIPDDFQVDAMLQMYNGL